MVNKTYYWECHPDLPVIDSKQLKSILEKLPLSKDEKIRNLVGKEIVISTPINVI